MDLNKGGDGGDIIFTPGKGYPGDEHVGPGKGGNFIFNLPDGSEYMKIDANGQVWIHKRRVASDMAVYCGFRNWLGIARWEKNG